MEAVKEKGQLIKVKPIDPKVVDQYADEAQGLVGTVKDIEIVDQSGYEFAASLLKTIKEKSKLLEDERKKIVGPLDMAKKAVQALFRGPQDVLVSLESGLKSKMIAYAEVQERKRREEQERLQRQAEAERRKKEEQERAWREKEEAKRREAAKLEAEGKEEEARKAREAAEKAAEKADERSFAADQVIAPVAAPKVDKVKGVSYRESWFADVEDFSKLPDDYKLPDTSKLNKVANATKGSIVIPGVVFKSKKILSSGV